MICCRDENGDRKSTAANKTVLAAVSPLMANILASTGSEPAVLIIEYDYQVVRALLELIYTGQTVLVDQLSSQLTRLIDDLGLKTLDGISNKSAGILPSPISDSELTAACFNPFDIEIPKKTYQKKLIELYVEVGSETPKLTSSATFRTDDIELPQSEIPVSVDHYFSEETVLIDIDSSFNQESSDINTSCGPTRNPSEEMVNGDMNIETEIGKCKRDTALEQYNNEIERQKELISELNALTEQLERYKLYQKKLVVSADPPTEAISQEGDTVSY